LEIRVRLAQSEITPQHSLHQMFGGEVNSSQVAFNKNKWQSHEFYKHDEWK